MRTKIIPVIHYESDEQTMRNAERAFDAGCDGVMLIHMGCLNHVLLQPAQAIKKRWPGRLVGVNFLGVDPVIALGTNIANGMDMTWTDEQLTHSDEAPWREAARVGLMLVTWPEHLLFVGVAFKHQRAEPDPEKAALKAIEYGFVPTTSGSATGVAAEGGKIERLRAALGDGPLATASGVTPGNANEFAPHLSHILVATGVSSSFHEFDPELLRDLVASCG